MGAHGLRGACPSLVGTMHTLGMGIGYVALLLDGLLVLRGVRSKLFRFFPLFYSYLVYALCGSLSMYVIYWLRPALYPSAYWIYYLVTILAEFAVLLEISDHVFQSFPAIRHLGRTLTMLITVSLAVLYVHPLALGQRFRAARFCLACLGNQGHYSCCFVLRG